MISGRGRLATIYTFFNAVQHRSAIAVLGQSGNVSWKLDVCSSTPSLPSAFALPPPLPDLKPGANALTLALNYLCHRPLPPNSLASSIQLPSIQLRAFFWPLPPSHRPRLVVVDIDGTITRSDVAGHLLPLIGEPWAQPGVVPLMQAIASNGYQIVYLTSRPLFLAERTRRYLSWLRMPQAPVITSPDGAWRSLKRELSGCAHLFKSEALEGIAKVFRLGDHPFEFYSAFGNRSTDVKAYAAAGIDPSRTYLIDSRGRVTCVGAVPTVHAADSSYAAMLDKVDTLFPPLATPNHH